METQKLIRHFLGKRDITTNEVDEIIKNIEMDPKFTWRDLGDREANFSSVHITEADEVSLLERLTNAMDAYIERFAEQHKDIKDLHSPYDVIKYLKEKKEEIYKDDIFVEVYNTKAYTNFLFWDNGIGLTDEEMPQTILSLQEANKFRKRYTMGAYGQGGSTACGNNKYTAIFSVKNNKMSFTIVRFNDLKNDPDAKNGKYQYLVSSKSNLPVSVPFSDVKSQFKAEVPKGNYKIFHGTTVFHIEFEKKIVGQNFWYMCDEILFNPAFAYTIGYFGKSEKKQKKEIWTTRTMQGLQKRLCDRDESIRISQPSISNYFNEDKIVIKSYYLKDKSLTSFLKSNPSSPIFATYNGQIHGRFSKRIIEEEAQLAQLKDNLIVEINCNSISNDSKKKTFTTGRQTLKKDAANKIKEGVVTHLKSDNFLKDENERKYLEETVRGLEKGSQKINEILAKLLRENPIFGNIKVKGTEEKDGDGDKKPSGPGSDTENTIIDTKEFPTYIKITNAHPIKAKIGKTLILKIESDISNESCKYYSLELGEEAYKYLDKDSLQVDKFENGRSKIKVRLKSNVNEDDNFNVYTQIVSHKLTLKSDERLILVVRDKPEKTSSLRGHPEIKPITREEDKKVYKRVFEDDDSKFAKYEPTPDNIIIYINLSNKQYKSFLEHNKIKNLEKAKTLYSSFLAYSCFNLEHSDEFKKMIGLIEASNIKNKDDMIENLRNETLSVAATSIMLMLTFNKLV